MNYDNRRRILPIAILLLSLLLLTTMAGCTPTVTSTTSTTPPASLSTGYPIEIVSIADTSLSGQTVNPGGPEIKITVKNAADEPVVSLNVTLEEWGEKYYDFVFSVSPSYPLEPNEEISSVRVLIGGGWGGSMPYSLAISGAMASGETFSFTWEPSD